VFVNETDNAGSISDCQGNNPATLKDYNMSYAEMRELARTLTKAEFEMAIVEAMRNRQPTGKPVGPWTACKYFGADISAKAWQVWEEERCY